MFPVLALLLMQAAPADPFLTWMDGIAQKQLAAREAEIAQVRSVEQAEARKAKVKTKLMELIGGWPDYSGPLNARVTGKIDAGGYTIEKVLFESLPQYWVTANLYVPKQGGRHPGILYAIGHWDQGKPVGQRLAGNLALKGFVVLAYDPVGQGERLQAFDKRIGKSLVGGATEQHFAAGALAVLAGEAFAKYHIWDAKRALDYLVSRPEVDAGKIGATGCSGGGTITTFVSALDDRIRVAAPTCYMNSFRVLFSGSVGDSEQTLPRFLAEGLDQADFVELFAPKPWLIGSTEQDFFTPAGARIVYEEARRWYAIYGKEDRVKWVVGPGGHGTPVEVREAIYDWMLRWLQDGRGNAKEQPIDTMRPDHEFQVTRTGQVATDLDSRDVVSFITAKLADRHPGSPEELKAAIRSLIDWERSHAPEFNPNLLKAPGGGRHPATLLVQTGRESATMRKLVAEQQVLLVVTPPGLQPSNQLSGNWLANFRMMLIGRNRPALVAYDIIRGLDLLFSSPDVDPSHVRIRASGVAGIWALMAAAIDTRPFTVELDHTPASFASAFTGVHRDLHDAVIPGFALRWEIDDLRKAAAPHEVIWRDPVDWMGNVVATPWAKYSTMAQ